MWTMTATVLKPLPRSIGVSWHLIGAKDSDRARFHTPAYS